ncbi:MAG: hypothetical protein ACJAXS_002799 [Colwellia sp.]|jgi:hypothetical protein
MLIFIQLCGRISVKTIKSKFQSAIGEFPLTEDFALKVNTDTYQEFSNTTIATQASIY